MERGDMDALVASARRVPPEGGIKGKKEDTEKRFEDLVSRKPLYPQ
jgi:hypothetical protein